VAPALQLQRHVTTSGPTHDAERVAAEAVILEQVHRFARRSVDTLTRQPEAPMAASDMEALLREAAAMGVVAQTADEGAGVWDTASDAPAAALSAQILRRLARSSAGVALAVHRTSLAQWIVRRLGAALPGRGVAAIQGRFGLGRGSLARCLAGAPLDDDDRAMLADCYGASEERLVTSHERFDWIVAPVADARGSFGWAAWPVEALSIRRHAHAHGLDELATFAVRRRDDLGASLVQTSDATAAGACFAAALCMEALGLMAIGLGAAEQAHARARAYASARSQGGRPIEGHPAVQLLLASSASAIITVEALVDAAARRPMGAAGLAGVLAARAEAHPLLCRGANDDLQVFGGSGYMRDTGAEKTVRDLNHLRVTSGSPPELSLFVAEWETIHGG
jgi:acyl-CoA dehydrogenase